MKLSSSKTLALVLILNSSANAAPSPHPAAAYSTPRFLDYLPSSLRLLFESPDSFLSPQDYGYDFAGDSSSSSSSSSVGPFSSSNHHTVCPIDTPVSCTLPDDPTGDTCCYENNGLFLVTQFWDYNPATGPADLFTTHGLWSNKCGGGYEQFCNKNIAISNATEVLLSLGKEHLLQRMSYSWKDISGRDADLWEHEFNKHATCMDTINPDKCYDSDAPKWQYVGDFFETVVDFQASLPTYKFLQKSGIVPSTEKQYALSDILEALRKHGRGTYPRLGCTRSGALQEVWYYFHLKGSVVHGHYIPVNTTVAHSCPDQVWYYPKGSGNTTPGNGGGGSGDPNSGYLKLSGQPGCLISTGKWFTSGTCATFHKKPAAFGGITLTSSKGNCDVVNGVFSCARSNSLGQFTEDSDGNIVYGGISGWSAPNVPASNEQVSIVSGSDATISFQLQLVFK
ncbi:uncharacterized protein SAPINGB_P001461 [Magnusiomyces paraingens]|uniref:ribonuclease T2 n=1 Tax=Magnusiomyces paraingens TaxID=2606893 RepID=A0A5E8B5U6_9ASCO|nr:uncharacterized protein SAPINGB_P001461 [Saprochaete ingens]VVT46936.1 unnamed protein product [Saprochaete ingens]